MSLSPSPPPPPSMPHSRASSGSSPSSNDSSIIDELSFDYDIDEEGNIVRTSKGSSKSLFSTPSSPEDKPEPRLSLGETDSVSKQNLLQPVSTDADAIVLNSPVRRMSLSRSESAFPILSGPSSATSDRERSNAVARSFQRVASGPILSTTSSSSNALSAAPIRPLPRRVDQQYEARQKRHTEELRAKLNSSSAHYQPSYPEEKENIRRKSNEIPSVEEVYGTRHSLATAAASTSAVSHGSGLRTTLPTRSTYGSASLSGLSRPHGEAPLPQRPLPTRRALKATGSSKYHFDRISEIGVEVEAYGSEEGYGGAMDNAYGAIASAPPIPYSHDTDDESDAPSAAPVPIRTLQSTGSVDAYPLSTSGHTRPRRSASLSDALYNDDEHHPQPLQASHQPQRQLPRPGTSLGLRREVPIVPARRLTIEDKLEPEYKNYQEPERDEYHLKVRQSPSPTQNAASYQQSGAQSHSRPAYSAHKRRDSDTLRNVPYGSSPTAVEGKVPPRLSPPTKGTSSSGASNGTSSAVNGSNVPVKHRRSPTAPEPPTSSANLQSGVPAAGNVGKTWAAGDRDSGDDYDIPVQSYSANEKEGRRERGRSQQSGTKQQAAAQSKAPAPPTQQAANANTPPTPNPKHIVVNRKTYARLDMIGKGGSSRVYRVMNNANELYAIKRVSLDKTDAETISSFMNEIALLRRLEGNKRIIRLLDSEVKAGAGGSKGFIFLVMECGEIDLARLISERIHEGLDMVWIAYYWQQMLQAVQVIHDEKIVHSDLKPANFVVVKGQLKLIDFGIASAIANDTTNIQRDHQIGTLNYMSPEAIELPEGTRRLKVGRASDVWSLGCILYQMVYGQSPFSHLAMWQKMKAIPDPAHEIDFPEYFVPTAPRSSSSPSHQAEPKKLEHLKKRVRSDVIANIRSCLRRNPKERMTIPELLEQDWLVMKEPRQPAARDLLAHDETIITPFYMRQLLQYGISLGQSNTAPEDPASLTAEAERLVKELKSVQLPPH